jgi:hypothetical protein
LPFIKSAPPSISSPIASKRVGKMVVAADLVDCSLSGA